MEGLEEARRLASEIEALARRLYGRRWIEAIERLEEIYDGDPWAVLDHLRREAEKAGIASR